ncbi:hypothetical protein [Tahibacter caeni]|uniref:hypothetical protein n=1 Tax=Tahibacter caeni TaxID=1453545 RepID=UPI0021483D4E|nr:hypothetical protein [Tahibacter caeni]
MSFARLSVLLAVAVFLLPASGHAAKNDDGTRFIDTAHQERFADQAAAIRQQMKTGGRFEYVSAAERQDVERQLALIENLLAKRGGQLSDNDQLDLLAAQETANAILTQRDGRRLICEYSAPTGSNRKVKQCVTLADRMRAQKETRNYLRETLGKSPSAGEQIDGLDARGR